MACRNHSFRSARLSFRFHSRHHLLTQAKPLPETRACVTSTRGGGGLSRFRVRSVFDELQSSPDATMSDERAAVGSICDSRLKCFRGCQYKLSYIILLTGMTLCIAGDIARGGKALSSFSASLQAGVLA